MLGILPDHSNRHLVLRVAEAVQDLVPLLKICRWRLEMKPPQNQFVDLVALQRERHLVDRKVFVPLLNHGLQGHIAKQRDLLAVIDIKGPLGATHEHVRLDTDLPQDTYRVLRGLCFQLTRSLEVWHEREMDKHAVLPTHIDRDLPDRFQEGQTFDVADSATDFRNHDVGVVVGQFLDHLLNLIGDVWNHLHGLAEKLAASLLVDD